MNSEERGNDCENSVILGFDVGSQKSVVSWAEPEAPGRADLILNDLSNLATPSFVSLSVPVLF